MTKNEYKDMFETKKQIRAMELAMDAGYGVDPQIYCDALTKHTAYVAKLNSDAANMTSEEYECFRLRYVCGLSYHEANMLLTKGLKSESCIRKRISRWLNVWGV